MHLFDMAIIPVLVFIFFFFVIGFFPPDAEEEKEEREEFAKKKAVAFMNKNSAIIDTDHPRPEIISLDRKPERYRPDDTGGKVVVIHDDIAFHRMLTQASDGSLHIVVAWEDEAGWSAAQIPVTEMRHTN